MAPEILLIVFYKKSFDFKPENLKQTTLLILQIFFTTIFKIISTYIGTLLTHKK
jgi:hypothetical protein